MRDRAAFHASCVQSLRTGIIAVLEVDDDDLGQVDEVEPLVEYCRDRFATYKIPKYIRFCGNLPLTANGKVLRRRMRELTLRALSDD